MTIALVLGAVLAIALVKLASTRPPRGERLVYAVGLVIAALVYVFFAIAGGASAAWLAIESSGVLAYGGMAWAGLRRWPWLLVMGWTTHVIWDVLLHLSGQGAEYTPHWYPWLCTSFDLVIAGAALLLIRREST